MRQPYLPPPPPPRLFPWSVLLKKPLLTFALLYSAIDDLKLWLDNLVTRVPGATIIIIGTKLDLVPENILNKHFEPYMRGRVEKLVQSEPRFKKIRLAGIEFVSSNPKFKDYNRSKMKFQLYARCS